MINIVSYGEIKIGDFIESVNTTTLIQMAGIVEEMDNGYVKIQGCNIWWNKKYFVKG